MRTIRHLTLRNNHTFGRKEYIHNEIQYMLTNCFKTHKKIKVEQLNFKYFIKNRL